MPNQLIHESDSKSGGFFTAPAKTAVGGSGVISRYDIVSLNDNDTTNATLKVTNKSADTLEISVEHSDASISDNGWPDYNFETSFANLIPAVSLPAGCSHLFVVPLTRKFLQLRNETAGEVAGQVFVQATFPKMVNEIGRTR